MLMGRLLSYSGNGTSASSGREGKAKHKTAKRKKGH